MVLDLLLKNLQQHLIKILSIIKKIHKTCLLKGDREGRPYACRRGDISYLHLLALIAFNCNSLLGFAAFNFPHYCISTNRCLSHYLPPIKDIRNGP